MGVNHFGPSVIGQEAYEENRKIEERGAHIFGPGVLDAAPPSAPAAGSEEAELLTNDGKDQAPPAHNAMSIPQLEEALEANPADFDRFYRGEFARPEGGRKGAFGVLLSFEQAHANRPEVVEALTSLLKAR